ncbi:MAG: hypothetical protein A2W00_14435 [Candidatus Eisenbacteria bacterium RBG_16_71_46]|nr:MAG: hypothetical protein A2W00_14435 [Candidatus Eisenbacteria bacterium RBG_16_71_46]OGF23671.1 MAG: hypothetical protein A2V63_00930 [Candidatus Eisenbacteria bacterium RBG_19FT_COMBO_70_11]
MTCQEAVDLMGEALEGQLQPALRPGFEGHMAECAPCATYLEHLHVTRNALLHLPLEGGTSPRRQELIEKFKREFGRG